MTVNWGEVAEQLFCGELPAAPVTRSGLLAQRATDPEAALASLRAFSPWSEAPHTLDDFDQSLAA